MVRDFSEKNDLFLRIFSSAQKDCAVGFLLCIVIENKPFQTCQNRDGKRVGRYNIRGDGESYSVVKDEVAGSNPACCLRVALAQSVERINYSYLLFPDIFLFNQQGLPYNGSLSKLTIFSF